MPLPKFFFIFIFSPTIIIKPHQTIHIHSSPTTIIKPHQTI